MFYKKAILLIIIYGSLIFCMIYGKFPTRIIFIGIIFLLCIICLEISKFRMNKKNRVLSDLKQNSNIKRIEELREKFKYNLNGCWTSCQGTFDNIMNETWIFYSNGKGVTSSNSLMAGQDKEEFRWREKGLFCIEITYSDDDEPTIWLEKCYDFCDVTTDCGCFIVLVERDEEGKPQNGFGLMNIPLLYESEID